MEIREKNWFEDHFYSFLEENKIALVLGDSHWLHKIERVTTEFTYFRWEGNRKQINGTLGKVEKERTNDTKKWAKEDITQFAGIPFTIALTLQIILGIDQGSTPTSLNYIPDPNKMAELVKTGLVSKEPKKGAIELTIDGKRLKEEIKEKGLKDVKKKYKSLVVRWIDLINDSNIEVI